MKTICIDIDGTITNSYFFVKYLNELTKKNISESEYTSQDWNDVYGEEFSDIYFNFDKDYGYIYSEAKVLDNVKKTIDDLSSRGIRIVFVTARSEYVRELTQDWMKQVGLDKYEVIYLGSNSGKLETALSLEADIFLEDDLDNGVALAENGIKVILMDANYNRGLLHENIFRVNNWNEINLLLSSMC